MILTTINETGLIQNDNQISRKHFTKMTKEERIYLLSLKDKLLKRGVSFGRHALAKMHERSIKEKDVLKAIKNGQIVEYKKIKNKESMIIRGCNINKRNEQIYVIFSLSYNKVITAYSNKQHSKHNKMKALERHNDNGYLINIPEYYKRKINFYYS